METKNNNVWRQSFASEIQQSIDADHHADVMARFDSVANALGSETSYLNCMAEITNQSLSTIQGKAKTIKDTILEAFEANKDKTIETNALLRTRKAIQKWNARLAEISKNVQVRVGNTILKIDEREYDSQRYDMPNVSRESYLAVASDKSGQQKGKLELEVRLFGNR